MHAQSFVECLNSGLQSFLGFILVWISVVLIASWIQAFTHNTRIAFDMAFEFVATAIAFAFAFGSGFLSRPLTSVSYFELLPAR